MHCWAREVLAILVVMPLKQQLSVLTWLRLVMAVAALGCADDDAGRLGPELDTPAESRIDADATLALSQSTGTLAVSESLTVALTQTFSDGSTVDVTDAASWSSDEPGVAWVQKGTVVGVSPGVTVVSAQYAGEAKTVTVLVSTEGLRAIEIEPAMPVLPAGVGVELRAVGVFARDTRRDLTELVRWRSSDSSIAEMDGHTAVTKEVGNVRIEAEIADFIGSTSLNVTSAYLATLEVTAAQEGLPMGMTQPLRAQGVLSDGEEVDLTRAVTWASDNGNVATVDAKGVMSAHDAGRVVISAELMGVRGKSSLVVTAAVLSGIDVTPEGASIAIGAGAQLHAIGSFSDGTTLDVTERARWSSSASTVLVVSNAPGTKGMAHSLRTGRVSVSATLSDITGSGIVTATEPRLVEITLAPERAEVAKGQRQAFVALGKFSDGTTRDVTAQVSWEAVDATKVEPDADMPGSFIGVGVGSSELRAWTSGISGGARLSVTEHALVALDLGSDVTLPLGTSRDLRATGIYSDGERADLTTEVEWRSSAETVASVSNEPSSFGRVSAVDWGRTVISAQAGPIVATAKVSVVDAQLTQLQLQQPAAPLAAGDAYMLQLRGSYTDGSDRELAADTATWTSSAPAVATVDTDGTLHARASGLATITATVSELTSRINVFVLP